jgi:type II secretory pathway pseudopilin PulG
MKTTQNRTGLGLVVAVLLVAALVAIPVLTRSPDGGDPKAQATASLGPNERHVLLEVKTASGEPGLVAIFWHIGDVTGSHPPELRQNMTNTPTTSTTSWSQPGVAKVGEAVSLLARLTGEPTGALLCQVTIGGKVVWSFDTSRTLGCNTSHTVE